MYIGVPGEFSATLCKSLSISLGKRRKITVEDIDELHRTGDEFEANPDYKLVNIQPIYYTLESGQKIIVPEGVQASRIGGLISFVLAEKRFISDIDAIMRALKIETSDYVSAPLAEVLFLFDAKMRDQYVILVDVGRNTTGVSLARGDGVLAQYNFSMGGGHITGDIMQRLGIGYTMAEKVKYKAELTRIVDDSDVYEVNVSREQTVAYPAKEVNSIITDRIASIAGMVKKCMDKCDYPYPDFLPYHLTGGGLCYLNGAKEVFARHLGKTVEIASNKMPQLDRPHLSSVLGLTDMVLRQTSPKKQGFLAKILGK